MKQTFVLHGDSQAKALNELLSTRKQAADAGKPLKVTVTEEDKRTDAQNRIMHSMFGDLSKQVKWHGKTLNLLIWKRLCLASFLREINENPELIPALDGNGFDVIYEKTSELGVKRGIAFIEWVAAFGGENEVNWTRFGKVDEKQW